jgi:hypothetical protein
VLGLGAPISVWIYFEVVEIPALVDAIDDEIAGYSARGQANGSGPACSDHVGELRRMRAELTAAQAAHKSAGRVAVIWPTVLAHGVVHGAARHAQRRAEEATSADAPAARAALSAAQRSERDFDAVDTGGRDAVWL